SAMRIDELNDSRCDISPKPRTVEHTIVANDWLNMMGTLLLRYIHTEVMCGPGLANAGNIVLLAFDRHQRHFGDSRRLHQLAALPVVVPSKRFTQKYMIDRLDIELSRQVHNRKVLIVKLAMFFCWLTITL